MKQKWSPLPAQKPTLASLRALYSPLFARIRIDEEGRSLLSGCAARGPVIYALRSRNVIDFLALDELCRRLGLPRPGFVNELSSWAASWSFGKRKGAGPRLVHALETAGAAAVFLKRPPSVLDLVRGGARGKGLEEGRELMQAVIDFQRVTSNPVNMIPLVFVWSKRPDTLGAGSLDWLLGPREWPSTSRVTMQNLINVGAISLRVGEPVDLQTVLEGVSSSNDDALHRKIALTLFRRIERERRSITGPANKPAERVRQEILRSPRFQEVLDRIAPTPAERAKAIRDADVMLDKMQALPDGSSHRALDILLTRLFERIYAGLDVDRQGIERLRALNREGTLVLLPSHKSYIDFLVLSYAFYKADLPLPLIVAGDNFSFFPVGGIARHAGAFFIRRSFRGDRLYTAVVDAYVRRLVRDGYSIEVFLEGGRSRTGKLMEPKLGLLSMLVAASRQQDRRQVHFVPVSIGYERLIEAAAHRREILGGEKIQEGAGGLLGAAAVLRNRYGRVNLQFGETFSLDQLARELGFGDGARSLSPKQSRQVVTHLAGRVMDEINRVTAVTPGALVALSLLAHDASQLPQSQLLSTAIGLGEQLRSMGARVAAHLFHAERGFDHAVLLDAVELFAAARLVAKRVSDDAPEPSYTILPHKRIELDTSKNLLIHFFVGPAIVASVLAAAKGDLSRVRSEAGTLVSILEREFRLPRPESYAAWFDTQLAQLERWNVLHRQGDRLSPADGDHGMAGQDWLKLYAGILRCYIEGYWVVGQILLAETEPLAEKDLLKKGLQAAKQLLGNEISRPEAGSKPLMQNALVRCQELGLLRSEGERLGFKDEAARERLAAEWSRCLAAWMPGE